MQCANRRGLKCGVLLAVFGLSVPVFAQDHSEALEWFQDARFGIFVHWTSQSISGDWSENAGLDFGEKRPDRKEQIRRYQEFNPVHFDAEAWVDIVKQSGAQYLTFTSKHVLGFCMWDNPYSEFDIMSTPFKRDICKELADALRKEDLGIFWYYGSMDCQHPDYARPGKDPNSSFYDYQSRDPNSPFYDYQSKTVECLLTNYGRITGMWWDGSQRYHNKELMDLAKRLQPHLLMTGRYHKPSGDFLTPEQEVGAFNITTPWESCIPIQGITWMWNGGRDIKDVPTCLRTLVQCAIGGGNLLLNISPKPDGTLQQEQVDVLLAMGDWLKQYGSSIYGTRGGPYKPAGWGGSTRKGNTVYLHVMQHIEDGQLVLPALPLKVKHARVLTAGDVSITEAQGQMVLSLDETARHPDLVTTIELELEGDAMALDLIETRGERQTLIAEITATASSARFPETLPDAVVLYKAIEEKDHLYKALARAQNSEGPIPEELAKLPKYPFTARKRGFRYRYWMAAENDAQPWLAFDLGALKTFNEVHVLERLCRIRSFELQYQKDNEWVTFYKGGRMNFFDVKLKSSVTAQHVRLLITKTEGGPPGITLVDLF